MEFLTVKKFKTYQAYFREFLVINRIAAGDFSLRNFAKDIGWPHSLLRDLAEGSKKLSVLRALEFSQLAQFDAFDTEWLVNLALSDSSERIVSKHFRRLIERTGDGPAMSEELKDTMLFYDARAFAVYCLLASCQTCPQPKDIATALHTFHMTAADIEAILQKLVQQDLVSIDGEKLSVASRSVFFREDPQVGGDRDAMVCSFHTQLSENLQRYLEFGIKPRLVAGGYVLLENESFEEMKEKGVSWFRSLEARSSESFERPSERGCLVGGDRSLFQYCVALVPITPSNL